MLFAPLPCPLTALPPAVRAARARVLARRCRARRHLVAALKPLALLMVLWCTHLVLGITPADLPEGALQTDFLVLAGSGLHAAVAPFELLLHLSEDARQLPAADALAVLQQWRLSA